mgnify:CR=1 FL=1
MKKLTWFIAGACVGGYISKQLNHPATDKDYLRIWNTIGQAFLLYFDEATAQEALWRIQDYDIVCKHDNYRYIPLYHIAGLLGAERLSQWTNVRVGWNIGELQNGYIKPTIFGWRIVIPSPAVQNAFSYKGYAQTCREDGNV